MEQNQNGLSQFGLSDKALSLLAKLEEQERKERLGLDVGTLNYVHEYLEDYINNELNTFCLYLANDLIDRYDIVANYPIVEDCTSIINTRIGIEILGIIEYFDDIASEILDDMEEQEELNNRDSEYCEMSGFNCDDCYISECSSSACGV